MENNFRKINYKRRNSYLRLSIFILSFLFFSACHNLDEYKRKGKQVVGEITHVDIGYTGKGQSTISIEYFYFVNNIKYLGEVELQYFPIRRRYALLGKKFPVLFLPDNIGNGQILIQKADFYYYELPFPDSLQWVEEL